MRDVLYVPLRGGESSEHRILHRGIRSGTPLVRLSSSDDTGYTLVQLEDGREGYIQTQYLSEEPIARDLLDATNDKLLAAEGRYQQTLLRLQEAEARRDELEAAYEALIVTNDELKGDYDELKALSENVIAVDAENRAMIEERETILEELDTLTLANQALEDTSEQQWFLRGAGVVLLGLLFGFWIARRIYHRRNSTGWS